MAFFGSVTPHGEWKHFRFTLDDGVGAIVLTRPARLNALTFEIYADLRDLLAELSARTDVRVLTITGEGKGFCSGGDVEEIMAPSKPCSRKSYSGSLA
jgi:enoyl-CoA hydratase/carnithine racemase